MRGARAINEGFPFPLQTARPSRSSDDHVEMAVPSPVGGLIASRDPGVETFDFDWEALEENGALPIMDYTGRRRPKGLPFPGWRYIKSINQSIRVGISQVEVLQRAGKTVV